MRRRAAALLALFLAACSGGGDSAPVTPPATPTISVSLASSAGTAARSTSATTTVSVARGGGYTGAVSLSATGAPAGVTVSFDPASLSGSTTSAVATFAVGASAAPGTATITVSASGSGVTTATSTYTLTIPSPGIGVTVATPTVSVTQGTSGNVGVTVSRSNGFAEAISLTASGLPVGVTATFAPASVAAGATSSTLAFAVTVAAAPGSYPVTITASGTGVTSATATVTLAVTAAATPAFGLSAAPAALSIAAGQSATATLTATRSGGFSDAVAVTVTGAPAGMTATLTPTSIAASATTSTLTVATTTAVAPGSYTLTVSGTGTGVSAQSTTVAVTVTAAPGLTLTASAAATTGAVGGTATVAVTLARLGGFAGDVTLAVQGLPSGITAAFAPGILAGTTVSSTLTLTIGATAAPGTYALQLNAAGAGGVSAQAPLSLTVTVAQGYTLAASSVSLTQGGTGTSTVTVTRTGGFAGTVNLAVGGLPSGVTASVNPAAVTGTSATITFTASGSAATGAFSATVTGTATGLANVSATVSGTVAPGGGGGTGNVTWTFCDLTELPLFVAYRNGRSGAWVRATNSGNNTYRFQIDDAGGVAIVKPLAGGTADVTVWYGSGAQLVQIGQQECTSSPATKTLTGSFAGVSAAQVGTVSVGGGFAQTTPGGPATFTVSDVAVGATDLLAFRSAQGFNGGVVVSAPDRGILRRNVDYAANSAIPTLDFNAAEAFAPASAQVTVNNAGSGLLTVFAAFQTNAATFGGFSFGALFGGTNPYTVYGVPANLTRAGDFHLLQATSTVIQNNEPVESRTATQFNQNLATRTLTLGPSLTQPTYTSVATSPYARIRARGPWQSEYGDQVFANFQQQTSGTSRNWTVVVTRAYSGSSGEYEAEVPDLNGVTGWDSAWGLRTGIQLSTSVFAYSTGSATGFAEGLIALTAGRFGTLTP